MTSIIFDIYIILIFNVSFDSGAHHNNQKVEFEATRWDGPTGSVAILNRCNYEKCHLPVHLQMAFYGVPDMLKPGTKIDHHTFNLSCDAKVRCRETAKYEEISCNDDLKLLFLREYYKKICLFIPPAYHDWNSLTLMTILLLGAEQL
jgi:hypothetical protein